MQKLCGNLLNLFIVVICLSLAMLIQAKLSGGSGQPSASAEETLEGLPYKVGGYTGREAHAADIKGYPGELHRIYEPAQGNSIELLAFSTPVNVHGPENCLPYMGWSLIDRERRNLQVNPAIELQTVVAASDDPAEHPLVCGYYWRRNRRAKSNLFVIWLQQRWATLTRSLQDAELVSICTNVGDVRQAGPAIERVQEFANDLEPYFHRAVRHRAQ
jgi:EpsI family protein